MDSSETTPIYNLKVAVQKTGIKPDTLRSWERRYNLPQPGRTSGGHRLYSELDIQIVKWLMARLEEGMTIGLAVDLWQNLLDKGEDPLKVAGYQPPAAPVTTEVGSTLADMRQQWIESCLDFDEAEANTVLTHAFSLFPVEMVCQEILMRGMAHIGELWFQNQATIPQEHFASALTRQRLEALLSAAPSPTRSGRIVLACPANEEHTIVIRLLNLILRYQGWEVIYLGANIPNGRLNVTMEEIQPDLVILSAQRLLTASTLLDTAQHLQENGVVVAYGGGIFNREPTLKEYIPGHFLGKTIYDALPVVEQIISFPATLPESHHALGTHQNAIAFFRSRQALIGADVWRNLKADQSIYPFVSDTNERMALTITAGLNLGHMDLIDKEFQHTRHLMVNHGIPSEWTDHYLKTYHQAASWHLGSDCQVVVDWLDKISDSSHA